MILGQQQHQQQPHEVRLADLREGSSPDHKMSSVDTTVTSSPAFDPFTQIFTLSLSDGTPFNVSVPDLDAYILYNVDICINYSAQLGASLVLLVILVLLTKSEKRRSPIFILNAISLALNTTRNVLQCLYFTGPFSETYAYFAQDYTRVPPSSYATSIAGTVLTLMLLVCVELSLVLQTRVVCTTIRDAYRHCILGCSLTVALLAIGFRFALVVENSKYIIAAENFTPFAWLGSATNITASISICFFCAVFVTKLGLALNERRKLGLQQFGPMQVIFIMGCQTLVIPGMCHIFCTPSHLGLIFPSHFLYLAILHRYSRDGFKRPYARCNFPTAFVHMGLLLYR